jgi:hypothetical protein
MIDVLQQIRTSLTVRLQVVRTNSGRPLHGCPVRLRRCGDQPCGHETQVEVRISDHCGWTEFDGLLPPAAPGHWPHLHFDIHGREGRLALPGDCFTAYASSAGPRTDLAAAFGAGEPLLIASVTGDAHRGLVATRTLTVG